MDGTAFWKSIKRWMEVIDVVFCAGCQVSSLVELAKNQQLLGATLRSHDEEEIFHTSWENRQKRKHFLRCCYAFHMTLTERVLTKYENFSVASSHAIWRQSERKVTDPCDPYVSIYLFISFWSWYFHCLDEKQREARVHKNVCRQTQLVLILCVWVFWHMK